MLPDSADLIKSFAPLSNWQDRYRQIIQLSKLLPELPSAEHTDDKQIIGCENRVWLTYQQDEQQRLYFYGDSEGRIVKGLLAIVIILANGKTAEKIAQTDFLANIQQLRIIDGLSDSRQLGLNNIISHIKQLAQQC